MDFHLLKKMNFHLLKKMDFHLLKKWTFIYQNNGLSVTFIY